MHACMVWWSGGRHGRSPVSLVHGPLLPSAQGGDGGGWGVVGKGKGVRPEATRCDPLVACGQLRRHQDGHFGPHAVSLGEELEHLLDEAVGGSTPEEAGHADGRGGGAAPGQT